ncbi:MULTISPECIES: [NiFe]-hydrogenase assembly chaperone HybE [Thiomicrorhabdus]|uniref:[NiFe]-hydrogenase assembly chaperone HybE n=1 Tax=Thiomicrorhabdus heinhorstiae TaxID=2748010 RepID=A0ABS0C003_9GAMM|nr:MULTISPECIES: [NiFe]-hydrogenase assembly chaperone HybE [Thiomicrorhabdus]MBF6057677.1 [NiFe]-hydrogenase assembly chaperone HybE [Thiomicrorhabdus heinhorstiae]
MDARNLITPDSQPIHFSPTESFDVNRWKERVESYFEKVYQGSMKELPIVNTRLSVGFASLKEICTNIYLGAMVSPWFVNLIFKIVDEEGTDRHHQLYKAGLGETVLVKFPSGDYEFIVNHEAELGYFYTCSLVSDTHVFENQEVAVSLADQCLRLVFDTAAKEPDLFKPQNEERSMKQKNKVEKPEEKRESVISRRKLFGLDALAGETSESI